MAATLFREVDVVRLLQPLSTFAISLIAVTAGGHFSYRRLHNAMRRILFIAFFEVSFAVILVYLALSMAPVDWPLGEAWPIVLVLSVLAASTAPATSVALIRESHAKGPTVKTLLAVVSVDSSLCIVLFAFVHSLLAAYYEHGQVAIGLSEGLLDSARQLIGSAALGIVLGAITSQLFDRHRFHNFSTVLVAILFATGISSLFGLSALLTCLTYGAFLANTTRSNERQLDALEPIEPLLYTVFFTLSGIGIHLDLLWVAGLPCAFYVLARGFGKSLGALTGAILARCSKRIVRSIPLGFMPQAGVVLGLAVVFEGDPRIPDEISSIVMTLVLASVTVNEIFGPFFTRTALVRANEVGLDRPRLVEFLDEEFILMDMKVEDKWDALRQLTDFYARTHRIGDERREAIYESVAAREKEHTTAVGRGAALPHGYVKEGSKIRGVMGICPDGVDFDAPDGQRVRLFVMIVTPQDHERRHLEVLASLSAMVADPVARSRLIASSNANEAWEVLESEAVHDFNYFLEAEEGDANGG